MRRLLTSACWSLLLACSCGSETADSKLDNPLLGTWKVVGFIPSAITTEDYEKNAMRVMGTSIEFGPDHCYTWDDTLLNPEYTFYLESSFERAGHYYRARQEDLHVTSDSMLVCEITRNGNQFETIDFASEDTILSGVEGAILFLERGGGE